METNFFVRFEQSQVLLELCHTEKKCTKWTLPSLFYTLCWGIQWTLFKLCKSRLVLKIFPTTLPRYPLHFTSKLLGFILKTPCVSAKVPGLSAKVPGLSAIFPCLFLTYWGTTTPVVVEVTPGKCIQRRRKTSSPSKLMTDFSKKTLWCVRVRSLSWKKECTTCTLFLLYS